MRLAQETTTPRSTMQVAVDPYTPIRRSGFEPLRQGHFMRDDLLRFMELKNVQRAGWVRSGVQSPESVAAHSWGMAVLALKLCPEGLDLTEVLKLCLVHDLPEVIVGDLTPYDDTSTKAADERTAMESLAPEWVEHFDAYEGQTTPEARFVKSLDKLDMGLQALVYQNTQSLDLGEFLTSARRPLPPELAELLDEPSE